MDNIKNDAYYLNRLLNDLIFITRHMSDIDDEAFSSDEILQDSMMFRLVQISENAKKLTDQYKEKHSDIPWTAVYGLRNRIVHDYGSVDLSVIFDTLKNDIPELIETVQSAVNHDTQ